MRSLTLEPFNRQKYGGRSSQTVRRRGRLCGNCARLSPAPASLSDALTEGVGQSQQMGDI